MKPQAKPIRYGKPCMTNLPPKLGRRIFDTIIHTPPFDFTQLDKQCACLENRLAKLAKKVVDNETTRK